jgi:hypothetical protein
MPRGKKIWDDMRPAEAIKKVRLEMSVNTQQGQASFSTKHDI